MLPQDAKEIPELIILFTKSMGLEPMLESIKRYIRKKYKSIMPIKWIRT